MVVIEKLQDLNVFVSLLCAGKANCLAAARGYTSVPRCVM